MIGVKSRNCSECTPVANETSKKGCCWGSTQIPINIIYLAEHVSWPHPLHLMPTPIPSTLWVSAGGNLMYAGNYLLLKRSAISLIFVMQINAHVTTEKLCHLGWSINC